MRHFNGFLAFGCCISSVMAQAPVSDAPANVAPIDQMPRLEIPEAPPVDITRTARFVRIDANLRTAKQILEACRLSHGETATEIEMVEAIQDVFDELGLKESDEPPVNLSCEYGFSGTDPEVVILASLSTDRDRIIKLFGLDDDEIEKLSDTLSHIEGSPILFGENGSAMLFVDGTLNLNSDLSVIEDKLQAFMTETLSRPFPHCISISCQPKDLRNTHVWTILDGVRAQLLTDAQQRDDEAEFTFRWRSISDRSMSRLVTIFQDEIDRVALTLDYDEQDGSLTIEFDCEIATNTPLSEYASHLNSGRNRSLSYLHPQQKGYGTTSIPIPDLLNQAIPALAALTAARIQADLNVSQAASDAIRSSVMDVRDEGRLDCLFQLIPGDDGLPVLVGTLPVNGGNALSTSTIELVAATNNGAVQLSIGEIDGWAVHRYDIRGLELFGQPARIYFTVTDHCLAFAAGSQEAETVLAETVRREFPESDRTAMNPRSALSLSGSVRDWCRFLEVDPSSVIASAEVADREIHDNLTVLLDADSKRIRLNFRFERDAILAGMAFFNCLLELAEHLDM